MAKIKTEATTKRSRNSDLKTVLADRRREVVYEVQGKIRDARRGSTKEREVLDQGESSEVDIQDEIEFALIQMKAETLNKIDTALRRLQESNYGDCFACGHPVAPDNPILNFPNAIGAATWTGWVQERGLYFLGEKDSRYVDLVSMIDSFPDNPGVKRGALSRRTSGQAAGSTWDSGCDASCRPGRRAPTSSGEPAQPATGGPTLKPRQRVLWTLRKLIHPSRAVQAGSIEWS